MKLLTRIHRIRQTYRKVRKERKEKGTWKAYKDSVTEKLTYTWVIKFYFVLFVAFLFINFIVLLLHHAAVNLHYRSDRSVTPFWSIVNKNIVKLLSSYRCHLDIISWERLYVDVWLLCITRVFRLKSTKRRRNTRERGRERKEKREENFA